jgi:glycosyltransferase involved in cell wall biosynthesis
VITIVITSYNYARYLPFAVESALAQSLPCQVVVVDDGSVDDSLQVLENYRDRIEMVTQKNGGEASAMYAGLLRARGEFVIFLDSDDILYPDCARMVQRQIAPHIAKLQWRLDTIGPNGEDRDLPFPHYAERLGPDEILRMSLASGFYPSPVNSGIAYARDYLVHVLPCTDTRFRDNADGYLTRLAPLFGKVVCLPMILGAYRVHGANHWSSDVKDALWSRYLRHELDRQEVFVAHARRRNLAVPDDALLNSLPHLECRLLSLRLTPESHPMPHDRRFHLLARGLRTAWSARDNSLFGRVSWAGYLLAVALLPRPPLRLLLRHARGAGMRTSWARALVRLARSRIAPTKAPALESERGC